MALEKNPSTQPTFSIARALQIALPIVVLTITAGYLARQAVSAAGPGPAPDGQVDYRAIGAIPVSEDGRVKPLDTVARNALLQISGKQSMVDEMLLESEDKNEADRSAIRWLTEILTGRPEARDRAVFRIDDPELLGLIGKTQDDGKYFSINDLAPAAAEIQEQSIAASQKDDEDQTRFEKHLLELAHKVNLYRQLASGLRPHLIPPDSAEQDWEPLWTAASGTGMRINDAASRRAGWATWRDVLIAFQDGNAAEINDAVQAQLALKEGLARQDVRKAEFEQWFNAFRPFALGIALYILAGLLGLLTLMLRPVLGPGWYRSLWGAGTAVLALTLALHTGALIARMWLQGRPPVTNLYSSAVVVGWATVLFALAIEMISRLGIASFASSFVGVATLVIAHNLAMDGDTMGVMQAVLDSNFWLGTHVITIILGYAAVFLAGFLAILYIVLGMFTPLLDKKSARLLSGMVYGVTCFALMFSFIGTVLGGIWADQSWGRFWGWDPKENGAIMIVLITAIILHARWGNLLKDRGIMVLAVSGNIITAWSWFGTNLLEVGLHSYGFMDGAMLKLAVFAISQLIFMGVAMAVPMSCWVSNYKVNPHRLQTGASGPLGLDKQEWQIYGLLVPCALLMGLTFSVTILTCFFRLDLIGAIGITAVGSPLLILLISTVLYLAILWRPGVQLLNSKPASLNGI
ncbi:MAG: cytochrome c biogenesis protein CcsA [Planctomycetota bacterium]